MTKISLTHLQAVAKRPIKRIGRGYGSGKGGHTSSRGQKGQNSRVGKNVPLWFEGGQLPMVKRTPYLRGKDRFDRLVQRYQVVTLTQLARFADKEEITVEALKAKNIVRSTILPVKIIATGELKQALTVRCLVSAGAKTAIERAGGSVILPEMIKRVEQEKKVSKKAIKKEKYKAAQKAAKKTADTAVKSAEKASSK